jgi:hypothetical protein
MSALDDKIRQALPRMSADTLRRNGISISHANLERIAARSDWGESYPTADESPRKRRRGADESRMQQALIRWFDLMHRQLGVSDPRLLMAFPLQGLRTKANASRMKAEGMRAGTPDLLLAVYRRGLPFSACDSGDAGLWIELKTARGSTTDSQDEMHALLQRQGYAVAVCRSLDEAIAAITRYLTGP